jgi:hypothetical protein
VSTVVRIIPPLSSDPDLVRVLEEALARARSGELTGVLLLEQLSNNCRYSIVGLRGRFEKLGMLAHAMHKLQDDDT